MRSIIRQVIGWFFIVTGIAGLFLPILQGWLQIAIGAWLLAPHVPFFSRVLCWVERRVPGVKKGLEWWSKKFPHLHGGRPYSVCLAAPEVTRRTAPSTPASDAGETPAA